MNRRSFLQFVAAIPVARVIPAMPIAAAPMMLSERALEYALIEIHQMTDARGLKLRKIMPMNMVVPSENYLEALRLARKNAEY